MPLLEINLSHYVSASVRLAEITAERPPTMLWTRRSTMFSRRTATFRIF
jgi:hypothetical protein